MTSFIQVKAKKLTVLIVTVAVIIIIVGIFYKGYLSATEKYEATIQRLEEEVERLSEPVAVYEEASKEIDIRVINAEIQDIGELATIEYLYTDAGKFEDPAELFGKEIPFSFTTKSFIVKWDGTIKAGVDISKVTAEVNKEKKEIVVHIPEAEILSHEIEDDSIETLDEKDGLFNKIKVEDIREFDINSKAAMEQRAIENGLLDKAFENAKSIIYKLLDTDMVEELEYSITFETINE
ncbi:DUF4230 domain-containing protein [Acetatifactor aquisgranensis]|uniref:DUF4230 domain-containing protein n=1 Tax=Acetatifactor aquisgranensis TaxID=2941233 RepID=UPI00203D2431|nr:DUF4230 domain-containing protein [Acetatifactor aquisgranensis]